MRKEVVILLFIFGFIAVVYVLMLSGEKSIQKNMKNAPISVQKTQETPPVANDQITKAPDMQIDMKKTYTAIIKTNMGDITVSLFASATPVTVNNFVYLARKNFYDNTIFHRVIKDFMIQGGDPDGNGTGGPGYTFEDEFVDKLVFDKPGKLAMANRGPATNGSQFFITTKETPWLTGKHTIFGEVTKGMDVVTAIENVATGEADQPYNNVTITDVEIMEK